jgi:hypothetical protein
MNRTRTDELIDELKDLEGKIASTLRSQADKIEVAVSQVDLSWSASTLGHHAEIYYMNFQRPPHPFNAEWGTQLGMPDGWGTPTVEQVQAEIERLSGVDLKKWDAEYDDALSKLSDAKSALMIEIPSPPLSADEKYRGLASEIESISFDHSYQKDCLAQSMNANRPSISRDMRAISAGGVRIPANLYYSARIEGLRYTQKNVAALIKNVKLLLRYFELHQESEAAKKDVEVHSMFSQMTNNPLTLRKGDGTTQPFRGLVTKGQVITFESTLPVEEGDIVERELPNHQTEQFEILDTGFYSAHGGIQAHYQMKVRKVTASPISLHGSATTTNVYNVHGPNARINNQSVDQSHNLVGVGEDELFQKLKDVIQASIDASIQREQLLLAIGEMQENAGKRSFAEKFQNFMSLAGNCMTVVTPFLPALANLAASAQS